jgi:hypothetical protein
MANNVSFCEHCGMITYLDGLQPNVNALPAHAFGRLHSTSGEELGTFFVLWADVDIVPERSERDAVHAG